MADVSWLFNALVGADKTAADSSPFAPMRQTSNDLTSAILKASPGRSAKDVAIASLLTGLFGGFADRLDSSYRDEQNVLARDVMRDYLAGKPIERPAGMSPSVFSGIENAASVFQAARGMEQQELRDRAKISTDAAVDQFKQLAPLQAEQERQRRVDEMNLLREQLGGSDSPLSGVATLPPNLQDNAIQQGAIRAQNEKIATNIENLYERAKKIPTDEALIPYSTASKELDGIGIALTTELQAALGREMNAKEQERLKQVVPHWSDTKEQIDMKKGLFKDLMRTISKETPLVDSFAVTLPKTPSVADSGGLPAGAQPTGRTSGGKPVYLLNGKYWQPD